MGLTGVPLRETLFSELLLPPRIPSAGLGPYVRLRVSPLMVKSTHLPAWAELVRRNFGRRSLVFKVFNNWTAVLELSISHTADHRMRESCIVVAAQISPLDVYPNWHAFCLWM